MKVLHVFKTYYPYSKGGIEKAIFELVAGMLQHKVVSNVLAFADKYEVIDNGASRIFFFKKTAEFASTPFSIAALWKFKKIAASHDIIHYHFPYPFADIMHFFSRIKKPYLVTYHADIVKQKTLRKLYRPLARLFLKRADSIIATSPNYLQSSRLLSQFKNKTEVIPLGIHEKACQSHMTAAKDWTREFGQKPFFLFVGALRYYKGLHILIDAASGAPYPVVILGAGSIEQTLKQQVKANHVTNVHFVGALDHGDKVALLKRCRALVFPSHLRSEAFGLSLVEGAMFSKALISSEIGTGTSYINLNGKTGIVIPPNDRGALRQAMDKLWEDRKLAEEMGKNAYQRYQKLFTADRMVLSYLEKYRQLYAKQATEHHSGNGL